MVIEPRDLTPIAPDNSFLLKLGVQPNTKIPISEPNSLFYSCRHSRQGTMTMSPPPAHPGTPWSGRKPPATCSGGPRSNNCKISTPINMYSRSSTEFNPTSSIRPNNNLQNIQISSQINKNICIRNKNNKTTSPIRIYHNNSSVSHKSEIVHISILGHSHDSLSKVLASCTTSCQVTRRKYVLQLCLGLGLEGQELGTGRRFLVHVLHVLHSSLIWTRRLYVQPTPHADWPKSLKNRNSDITKVLRAKSVGWKIIHTSFLLLTVGYSAPRASFGGTAMVYHTFKEYG